MRHAAKREIRFARHVFAALRSEQQVVFKNAKVAAAVDEKSTLHAGAALAKCKMREAKAKEINVKIDEPTGS